MRAAQKAGKKAQQAVADLKPTSENAPTDKKCPGGPPGAKDGDREKFFNFAAMALPKSIKSLIKEAKFKKLKDFFEKSYSCQANCLMVAFKEAVKNIFDSGLLGTGKGHEFFITALTGA